MKRTLFATVIVALAVTAGAQNASNGGSTAEEMLAAINAVKPPTWDTKRQNEKGYQEEYMGGLVKSGQERGKLILAFYNEYPTHEKTVELMNRRWSEMQEFRNPPSPEAMKGALADIDSILSKTPPAPIKQAGSYWKAFYKMYQGYPEAGKMLPAVDAFAKEYPQDDRGASLLSRVADFTNDNTAKLTLYKRIAGTYPKAMYGKFAGGKVKQIENIGKPFALDFTDAITDKKVSIAGMKGKVVVIDFWATWCGPCIAEMPKMKKLYADLHKDGLEIIGVSLDNTEAQGGLKALKDYVAKEQIAWPQYYQGKGWDSEFSGSWGINGIPCLFIIDKNGNLHDVKGRQDLENKVKALLAK